MFNYITNTQYTNNKKQTPQAQHCRHNKINLDPQKNKCHNKNVKNKINKYSNIAERRTAFEILRPHDFMRIKKRVLFLAFYFFIFSLFSFSGCSQQEMYPTNKSLPKNYDSFQFQLNDRLHKLPMNKETLNKEGFHIKYLYYEAQDIEANKITTNFVEYATDNTNSSFSVGFFNPSNENKKARECKISAIDVDRKNIIDDSVQIVFPGGVQIGSTYEKVIKEYGQFDDYTDIIQENRISYTWQKNSTNYVRIYISTSTKRVERMTMQHC